MLHALRTVGPAPLAASPRWLAPLALCAAVAAQEAPPAEAKKAGDRKITLAQVLGGAPPRFGVLSRDTVADWAPDGVHLTIGREWVEPLTGTKVEPQAEAAEQSRP